MHSVEQELLVLDALTRSFDMFCCFQEKLNKHIIYCLMLMYFTENCVISHLNVWETGKYVHLA